MHVSRRSSTTALRSERVTAFAERPRDLRRRRALAWRGRTASIGYQTSSHASPHCLRRVRGCLRGVALAAHGIRRPARVGGDACRRHVAAAGQPHREKAVSFQASILSDLHRAMAEVAAHELERLKGLFHDPSRVTTAALGGDPVAVLTERAHGIRRISSSSGSRAVRIARRCKRSRWSCWHASGSRPPSSTVPRQEADALPSMQRRWLVGSTRGCATAPSQTPRSRRFAVESAP
jgi:hypothetical protein